MRAGSVYYIKFNIISLSNNIFIFLVDTLGMEMMERVQVVLAKMRMDDDRDVRVFAGGQEQLGVLAYCSSDENNQVEQAKNILF